MKKEKKKITTSPNVELVYKNKKIRKLTKNNNNKNRRYSSSCEELTKWPISFSLGFHCVKRVKVNTNKSNINNNKTQPERSKSIKKQILQYNI